MTEFGNYHLGSEARRAHLALVEGGASTAARSTSEAARAAARPTAATSYSAAGSPEPARSRHEAGVRAVARRFDHFEDALLPMVLASGVSGETAASVVEAIMASPALRAQAERAFARARIEAV